MTFLHTPNNDALGKVDRLPGLKINSQAPEFTLKDMNGKAVSLSDFKGKKVILNFWATWCPPCKMEMKDFQTYFSGKDEDVALLAINIDPKSNVSGYIDKMGIEFPVLLDEKDQVNEQYKVITIPTTYFIDKNGIIKDKYFSAIPLELLREKVAGME
ncbi:peroxiredoxin family protein [Cytobacillus purgationiresistens]|uniref:Peroxiredoxin n=1 Tax=Cytobacillus purgationiresistens TaxID=863449 RepID=A0ABU0AEC9_9BACI|nr:TlpA disulfide reductase family protein [Cytobacillus purgationiresistens]MDQ0269609.1 peroxiredoxin [Cytobacillus purgationiresistens]